jgi:hypothetical protein
VLSRQELFFIKQPATKVAGFATITFVMSH